MGTPASRALRVYIWPAPVVKFIGKNLNLEELIYV